MQDSNDAPDEAHLEAEIKRLIETHKQHLELLESRRDEEMNSTYRDLFLCAEPDEKSVVADIPLAEDALVHAEWDVTSRHDDLLVRVNLAHWKKMKDLNDELKTLGSHPHANLPFAERFPSTIEEFRKLSEDPEAQYRVAQYLVTDDEEEQKKWFIHGKSRWRKADTTALRTIVQGDPTFREEVNQVVEYEPDGMEVDGDVPGLPLFNDDAL